MSLTSFLADCLSLFDGVLSVMWEVPIFRFFLLCFLFAVAVGVCWLLFHTAKGVAS